MKEKEIVKKVEVPNTTTSKPPQWNSKKGDKYLMWRIKFNADMVMKGLAKAFAPKFASKLPSKMTQIVKEYRHEDTIAQMGMEKAMSKLKLGSKKDLNDLLDELAAIKCRNKLDIDDYKKRQM